MRVVKEAEVRRQEILDAAETLFMDKGFDGTSTTDIIDAVGIARGTLYYHFESKEEIMNSIVGRYSETILDSARKIAANTAFPVTERIMRIVLALRVGDDKKDKIMDHMHNPQNALMHQKTQMAIIGGITPIIAGVVSEGIQEGLFSTPFPFEAVEMIVTYANIIFDADMAELASHDPAGRARALIFNAEMLFGAPRGSLESMHAMFGAIG